jgi:hypothetical protein
MHNTFAAGSETEKMRITSAGNVGIGETSPDANLVVASSSGATIKLQDTGSHAFTLVCENNSNFLNFKEGGGTSILSIDGSNQRVGIGETNPLASLHLGASTGERMYVYANATVRSGFGVDLSGSGRELSIFHSSSNQSDGNISFGHRYETGGAYTERMRITGAGNVGIGTLSPASKLDLGGSTSGQRITFSNTGVNVTNGARTQAEIGYKTGSYSGAAVIKILTETAYDDSMAVAFHTGSSATENMRIDSNQQVGIGTTSPNMKLNISHGDQDGLRFNCTSTTGEAFIDFGDSGDNDAGSIRYDHNDNSLAFRVNATERLRIDNQGNLKFADNGTNPTAVLNTAFLFNDGGELKVLDELGFTTTISPHNFELIPDGASEDMAFAYHSTKHTPEGKLKKVNVDMMKLARLVEQLTGEKLVYIEEGE